MTAESDWRWLPDDLDVDPEPDKSLDQFFSPSFMQRYTRFESFESFWAASPWSNDEPAIDQIGREELDRYVARTTEFEHWTAMRNQAAEREIRQRHLL